MILEFTSKHFNLTSLGLPEYLICLMYENNSPITKEIQEALKLSERQTYRLIGDLVNKGYLKKVKAGEYELTNKMYQ